MNPLAPHARTRTEIAPVDHALKASVLHLDRGLRLADAALAAGRLAVEGAPADAWEELWAIGDAAWRRYEGLQQGWVANWFEWLRYASQVGGATTFSKLAERELNIVKQAGALVSEQSVGLMNLWENVEVNVLHWMAEVSSDEDGDRRNYDSRLWSWWSVAAVKTKAAEPAE